MTYAELRDFLDRYTNERGEIQGDPATIAGEAATVGLVAKDAAFYVQIEEPAGRESVSDEQHALAEAAEYDGPGGERLIATLHETERGEGNGVIHWYCSPEHRNAETTDFGCKVVPIAVNVAEVPEGSRCETCGAELHALPEKVYPVPGFESDVALADRPLPDAWYWQVGETAAGRWVAAIDSWERETWWEGSDEGTIALAPDPWHRPIADVPTSGTLVYCVPTDEGHLRVVERDAESVRA